MLKEARKQAGLSREEAAFRLHIGTRTLYSYESEDTLPAPEVVLNMAEIYGQRDLPAKYCSTLCPIGQVIAYDYRKANIATIALGILKELTDAGAIKDRLIAIAADGLVAKEELSEFARITRELCELEREIGELKQFAAKNGISLEDIMPNQKEKAALQAAS